MSGTEIAEADQTLLALFKVDYVSVFDDVDVLWPEVVAATTVLVILHTFCSAFLFGMSSVAEIAFQTSMVLFLVVLLSVACTAIEMLFGIRRLAPRKVLLLLIGHYSVTLIAVLSAAFLWGGEYPFYNEATIAMWVYPAIALAFFAGRTISQQSGKSPPIFAQFTPEKWRMLGAGLAVAALVNLFNWRLFNALVLASSAEDPSMLRELFKTGVTLVQGPGVTQ